MGDHAAPKLSKIRAAFIGLGSRGVGHLKFFAGLPGTEVVAISDLYEDNVKEKLGMVNQLAEPPAIQISRPIGGMKTAGKLC